MIGNFYPLVIASGVVAGFATALNNPTNSRSVSAATEVLNAVDWIATGN